MVKVTAGIRRVGKWRKGREGKMAGGRGGSNMKLKSICLEWARRGHDII
jgi:hypothetical protein